MALAKECHKAMSDPFLRDTGVCGAIGQGLSLYDAARVGAWLCGRSAEIAIFQGSASEQSLLPSDVLDNLGRAFLDLEIGSTL